VTIFEAVNVFPEIVFDRWNCPGPKETGCTVCLSVYVLYKVFWKLLIKDYCPLECDVMYILVGCSLHSEASENQKFCDARD